ncbi:MAG TPA: tetratricopeptide repeat protein, partial [Sphingobacterium sp.]|nr:tetratricopeptide repeat protein [Sphingobacterium sp.]
MKRHISILLLLVVTFTRANGQVPADSRQQLKQWLDASFDYRYSYLDSSFYYGFKVLEAAKVSNYRDIEADALRSISTSYQAQGDYQKALDYGFDALRLSRELNDRLKTAHTLNLIGMVYDQQGNFPGALNNYQEAYTIYKTMDNKEWLAMIAVNLGVLFKGQGAYEKVIPYYRDAYTIYQNLNMPAEAAFCETNLGSVFYYTQQYDSCVYYSLRAEKALAEQNLLQIQPIAQCNAGIGYLGLGRLQEAKHYLEKALTAHRASDNKKEIAFVLIQLSKVYREEGQFARSQQILVEAKSLAEKIGSSKEVMDASKLLAEYYEDREDYRQAYAAHVHYNMVKDTLFEQEKMRAITNYQIQYETEKKEQQIEHLSQETAIQQLKLRQRGLLLAGSIILLSTIALFIYFIQNRRKIRAEALLQRKAAQEVLEAEERERRRIASDLHDGVGQMLSAALLNLNEAYDKSPEGSETRNATEKALTLLGESYDEMRSISHQMMPNALLKAGLASSIREFVERIDSPKMKVVLDIVGLDERLDEQTETVLYRVIQEAVNNVLKHAAASRLTIQLARDKDGVALTIEDNGRGFHVAEMAEFSGIGLRNIQSRIAML